MKTTIQLQGIGKKYPLIKHLGKDIENNFQDFWALKDISLEAYAGQILGIIGRNGAGKTTLLNIIAGVLSPTQGNIAINGRVLGLFNLGAGFQDEMTGRENIFLNGAIIGATRKELELKLKDIIEFSELGNFIDMPLGTYSQGMRLRLGFSILVNLDFDILVIDEVLAVGDALFQSKCFEKLMDFRRANKTLIITTQSTELIERLCDQVALLDHGRLLFHGDIVEGVNKYRTLLNTEKFFVGPMLQNTSLIENTKKWAEDKSNWGKKFGTKEVLITRVEFINRFGCSCSKVKSRERLKIKIYFTARNNIKQPHFGVAIFRNDGVYCYGPNTAYDSHKIACLKKGRGSFLIDYKNLLLAPGEYRVSVAMWDENETLAYDYHEGYYELIVTGNPNTENELLNMPFKSYPANPKDFQKNNSDGLDLRISKDNWGQKIETDAIRVDSVDLLNCLGEKKATFMSNEPVSIAVNFNTFNYSGKLKLWIGLYRGDGVYCQGITQALNGDKIFKISFPKLPLLPGDYKISLGVWDGLAKRLLVYHHGIYPLKMVFNKKDHGTVYLEHSWYWR
jgi:ABC-type polysaccharide/polyol phosphate transport system ATPase subunit